jgi:hypothetical protein
MRAVVIAGANANPGAPRDWDAERDGPCGKLPIRVTVKTSDGGCGKYPPGSLDRIVSCESAWKPDKYELETLNAGGCVILYIAGWQVPVSLRVEAAETAEQKAPEQTSN